MHRHERIQTFYVAENGRPIYHSCKMFGGGSKFIWTLFPGHGCICGNQPSLWKSNHAIVPWGKRLALSTGQRPSIGTNTGQDQLPYAPSWTHPNILRCRKWTSNIWFPYNLWRWKQIYLDSLPRARLHMWQPALPLEIQSCYCAMRKTFGLVNWPKA